MVRAARAVAALSLLVMLSTCSYARTISVYPAEAAAIQAAIGRSRPGDVIKLSAGTYPVTVAIKPKSGTKLIGAGAEKTVLRFAGRRPDALLDLSGAADVEVAHLTLDGARDPRAAQGAVATRARHLYLHHLTIRDFVKGEDFGPHGVHFTGDESAPAHGVTDSVISDCTFTRIGVDSRWGAAIRLSHGSSRNRVLRNRIDATGRGGILCDHGSTDTTIQRNVITNSGGEGLGIEVNGQCDRSVIEDNRVDHWISVAGCQRCAVRRNDIRDAAGPAKFCGIEGIGEDLVVTDNTVGEGQQLGLSISEKADHCFYGYNTFRKAVQWGAQLDGAITRQYFYRDTFIDTTVGQGSPPYPGDEGSGFRALGRVSRLAFEECRFSSNGRYGVQLLEGGLDAFRFTRCALTGNTQRAVAGPDRAISLAWVGCRVESNGNNSLPTGKPFPQSASTAAFTAPAAGRVGEPVRFVSTSRAASGSPAAFLWDFGDGAPATESLATHTYSRPGTYRVTLIMWDASGRGARAERLIQVSGPPRAPARAKGATAGSRVRKQGDNVPHRHTEVSIRGDSFYLNGRPTYAGRVWQGYKVEGLLLNSRMVQATFDDLNPETRSRWAYPDTKQWDPNRNTQEFVEAMPSWRAHGLLAVTLNLQGGNPGRPYSDDPQPWYNSAWTEDGQLRPAYLARLRRVLDRADDLGMVVILGLFYFGQDGRLHDEAAVRGACDRIAQWLLHEGYTNVLVEINNECDTGYSHEILQPTRVHELLEWVKAVSYQGRRLLVGTSYGGGALPGAVVLAASDFVLLHGNFIENPERIAELVRETRALPAYRPMPILFNEDDHYDFEKPMNNLVAAVSEHASWGFLDKGVSDYCDGYQRPPVNWGINTDRKRAFFELVREITGADPEEEK